MTPPRLLMITAHPDDETMFFLPTIFHFRNNGYEIHILCLSSGDSNGLGKWRKQELYFACSLLGISRRFVTVIEDPRLQDGLTTLWQEDIVAQYVQIEIARLSPTKVVTFDHNGASGHANHIQTSKGTIAVVNVAKHKLQLLLLRTVPIAFRYIGIFYLILSFLIALVASRKQIYLLMGPAAGWHVLSAHQSQFVWFRKFFVLFSSYMLLNNLYKA